MPTQVLHSEAEVVEWINYYEQGHEIPDDIMVKLLYMAQREAAKTTLKEHVIKWHGEAYAEEMANQKEFDESDCCEAMHAIEEWQRVQAFLSLKLKQLEGKRK